MIKLYSFQPIFVWESLLELGIWTSHFDLKKLILFQWGENEEQDELLDDMFYQAYLWLIKEMKSQKITNISNSNNLIWAWYHWNNNKQKKPDKRFKSVKNFCGSEEFVMLELEIEDDTRVSLHGYDSWHCVLNNFLLENNEEKGNEVEAYIKKQKKEFMLLNGIDKTYDFSLIEEREILSKSWRQIFNINNQHEYLECEKLDYSIQATIFEIFYTDVVKVHFFNSQRKDKILKIKR